MGEIYSYEAFKKRREDQESGKRRRNKGKGEEPKGKVYSPEILKARRGERERKEWSKFLSEKGDMKLDPRLSVGSLLDDLRRINYHRTRELIKEFNDVPRDQGRAAARFTNLFWSLEKITKQKTCPPEIGRLVEKYRPEYDEMMREISSSG